MQKQPHQSIRLFKSDFLERFSHVHPITPLVFWSPVIVWFIWHAFSVHQLSALTVGALGATALFIWSFVEYALHRFVFHFKAEGKSQERFQFLIHGLHHDDPQDATRLVMPPVAGVIIAVVLYSFFRVILGPVLVEPFFAFFLIGYLCYDYIHFYVHHFNPKTRIGKLLKQNHMMHHYADTETRWGVSSPLWDHVFGTLEREKKQQPIT